MKSNGSGEEKTPIKPLLPKITNDEIDLEVDNRRDDEIKNDRPPHHN
jgi:hypothetical protein